MIPECVATGLEDMLVEFERQRTDDDVGGIVGRQRLVVKRSYKLLYTQRIL